MSISSSGPSISVSSLNIKDDVIEPNPETAEEAIDREAKAEVRTLADKKTLIAMGETLQLKLRVRMFLNVLLINSAIKRIMCLFHS